MEIGDWRPDTGDIGDSDDLINEAEDDNLLVDFI